MTWWARLFLAALALVGLAAFLASPPHIAALQVSAGTLTSIPALSSAPTGITAALRGLEGCGYQVSYVGLAGPQGEVASKPHVVVLVLAPERCDAKTVKALAGYVAAVSAKGGRVDVVVSAEGGCAVSLADELSTASFQVESSVPGLGLAKLFTSRGPVYLVVDGFTHLGYSVKGGGPRLYGVAVTLEEKRPRPIGYIAPLRWGGGRLVVIADSDAFTNRIVNVSVRAGFNNTAALCSIIGGLAGNPSRALIVVPLDFYMALTAKYAVTVKVDPQWQAYTFISKLLSLEGKARRFLEDVPLGVMLPVALASIAAYAVVAGGSTPPPVGGQPARLERVRAEAEEAVRALLGVTLDELASSDESELGKTAGRLLALTSRKGFYMLLPRTAVERMALRELDRLVELLTSVKH